LIIKIKVLSILRQHLPLSDNRLDEESWNVPEGATIVDVLQVLNMPTELAKIFLVNGIRVDKGQVLSEGDVLHILPQIVGG
jgi:sulfur carrier protein ThiS